eukprot:scaffold68132_cov115-Phaeocystis_antarctica.AAC.1
MVERSPARSSALAASCRGPSSEKPISSANLSPTTEMSMVDGPRCSVASAERAMSVPLRLGAPGDARTSTAGLAGTTARETMARTGTTTSMT